MTRREIFTPGILSQDFENRRKVLGEVEAVWWGERCASTSDHIHDGTIFPLTGFLFQRTFLEWKRKKEEYEIANH